MINVKSFYTMLKFVWSLILIKHFTVAPVSYRTLFTWTLSQDHWPWLSAPRKALLFRLQGVSAEVRANDHPSLLAPPPSEASNYQLTLLIPLHHTLPANSLHLHLYIFCALTSFFFSVNDFTFLKYRISGFLKMWSPSIKKEGKMKTNNRLQNDFPACREL